MKNKTYPYIILLAGLPKGIAEKACRNAEKFFDESLDAKYDSIKDESDLVHPAICNGFSWIFSEQGYKYWLDVYDKVKQANL